MNTPEAIRVIRVLAGEHYFARNAATTDAEAILFQVIRHMAHSDFSSALSKLQTAVVAVMVKEHYKQLRQPLRILYITNVYMHANYSIQFICYLQDTQTEERFHIDGIVSINNGLTIARYEKTVEDVDIGTYHA